MKRVKVRAAAKVLLAAAVGVTRRSE